MIPAPTGIKGFEGREPIGAALTVGIKGSNGAPTEKDRFHVLAADAALREYGKRDGGSYKAPARDPHPAFPGFNAAAPERRRVIPAQLAHARISECFEHRYSCKSGAARIPEHPKKAPVCMGNGEQAVRWDGHAYAPIPCPGEQCEYTRPRTGYNGKPEKPWCGPWMRFLARFDFPPTTVKMLDGTEKVVRLPSVPFKFTSGGWNSLRNFVGFFDSFRRACEGYGLSPDDVPLFGLPVVLTLTEKTNPETQARFPVVSISMAGDADLIAWVQFQLRRGDELRKLTYHAPLALTDLSSESDLAADAFAISGPLNVPGGK